MTAAMAVNFTAKLAVGQCKQDGALAIVAWCMMQTSRALQAVALSSLL